MPLPEKPGIGFSVDYFGPLPVTPRGNTYILLFIDRFSRRADMYAVTAAEFTAEGTANILIKRYTPLWGCPCSILSDNGLQFSSKHSQAAYKLLGVRKIAASSYHPKWQWRDESCESHDGPIAGNGGQRAPKQL